MKKVIVAILLFAGCDTFSWSQSMLRVRLADSSQINISVDGRYFGKRGTSITVGDLPAGNHRLTIYALRLDRWGRGHQETIFEGKVKTQPDMATIFIYDDYNDQINISDQDIASISTQYPNRGRGQHFRDEQGNMGQDGNYDPGQGQQNSGNNQGYDNQGYTGRGNDIQGYSNQGNNNQAYDNGNNNLNNSNDNSGNAQPANMPNTIAQDKLDDLKKDVDTEATDVKKTELLKNRLASEKLSTAQVSSIMDWFLFESSKVDFAKWAYSNTVDKENYLQLENKFSYKASQDELEQFIKGQK